MEGRVGAGEKGERKASEEGGVKIGIGGGGVWEEGGEMREKGY